MIELLRSGELSAGHGRALLMLEDDSRALSLAHRAVKDGLSVRKLEELVARVNSRDSEDLEELSEEEQKAEASLRRLEERVRGILENENLSLRVDPSGKKRLSISFETEAAWKRFMTRIRD